MRTATLNDFLTEDQIKDCMVLYRQYKDTGDFIDKVTTEILEPNITSINAKLNQENHPRYLAYAIEFTFGGPLFWKKYKK